MIEAIYYLLDYEVLITHFGNVQFARKIQPYVTPTFVEFVLT